LNNACPACKQYGCSQMRSNRALPPTSHILSGNQLSKQVMNKKKNEQVDV